jgi:hypothetical protein
LSRFEARLTSEPLPIVGRERDLALLKSLIAPDSRQDVTA